MIALATFDEVDAALAAWEARLRRVDDNLVALEGERVYQRLAGEARALEGLTAARVRPALAAVEELFEDRARLAAVIDRAREVRASVSALAFWEHEGKLAELSALLRGASIVADRRAVQLGERGLLDESHAELRISADDLLARMTARFDEARDAIFAVSRAWDAIAGGHVDLALRAAALRSRLAEASADARDLAAIEADLARWQARAGTDPLGAEDAVAREIGPRLAALGARLAGDAAARGRAEAALVEARAALAALRDDHARTVALVTRARRTIAGEVAARLPPPLDEGLLLGLAAWLAKLEATVAARRVSSAEVGLARFLEAAHRERVAASAAHAAAAALLALPDELAGRLSARRAQADTLAARGRTLPEEAETAAREAAAILRRRPIDVDALARAVDAFEGAVIAAARR